MKLKGAHWAWLSKHTKPVLDKCFNSIFYSNPVFVQHRICSSDTFRRDVELLSWFAVSKYGTELPLEKQSTNPLEKPIFFPDTKCKVFLRVLFYGDFKWSKSNVLDGFSNTAIWVFKKLSILGKTQSSHCISQESSLHSFNLKQKQFRMQTGQSQWPLSTLSLVTLLSNVCLIGAG